MDMVKKFFPNAFTATDVKPFIIALVIYLLIDVVCGFVIGLLAKIPLLGIIFGLLGSVGDTVTSVQFILQYVVIIINILFLHTCFVLITSEKQYEKDKQQLAKEQNEAIKKMEEKRAARQEKLNRRNGKK